MSRRFFIKILIALGLGSFFPKIATAEEFHTPQDGYEPLASVKFLRTLGIDLNEMMNDGILFPIIEVGAKFHAPAKFDDELEIITTAEVLSRAKMKFNYEIRRRGEEKILAEGNSTNVFTSDGKICRLPDKFFSKLAKGLE